LLQKLEFSRNKEMKSFSGVHQTLPESHPQNRYGFRGKCKEEKLMFSKQMKNTGTFTYLI